jgi:hypothetical protein
MAPASNIQEFTQPLIRAPLLRDGDIRGGDIEHLLQGIRMEEPRYKSVSTRVRNNRRQYLHKIFKINLFVRHDFEENMTEERVAQLEFLCERMNTSKPS